MTTKRKRRTVEQQAHHLLATRPSMDSAQRYASNRADDSVREVTRHYWEQVHAHLRQLTKGD